MSNPTAVPRRDGSRARPATTPEPRLVALAGSDEGAERLSALLQHLPCDPRVVTRPGRVFETIDRSRAHAFLADVDAMPSGCGAVTADFVRTFRPDVRVLCFAREAGSPGLAIAQSNHLPLAWEEDLFDLLPKLLPLWMTAIEADRAALARIPPRNRLSREPMASLSMVRALDYMSRAVCLAALRETGGHTCRAADMIGKDRKRFGELLDELGIDPDHWDGLDQPEADPEHARTRHSESDGRLRIAVLDGHDLHGRLRKEHLETLLARIGIVCQVRWYVSLDRLEADRFEPHAVIAHLNLTPRGGGARVCADLRERSPELRCLVYTAQFESGGIRTAEAVGLGDWVVLNPKLDGVVRDVAPLFLAGAQADHEALRLIPRLRSRRGPAWRPEETLAAYKADLGSVFEELALQIAWGGLRVAAGMIRVPESSLRSRK